MKLNEFISKKTRIALTWFVAIVLSILSFAAAFANEWDSVINLATMLGSVTGLYQISQAYTKGEFIKKVGKVDTSKVDTTIEP